MLLDHITGLFLMIKHRRRVVRFKVPRAKVMQVYRFSRPNAKALYLGLGRFIFIN